ncbi:MAG: hypothetical protein RBR48_00165 [Bacilli bacterium]|jgi:hypothetical protein|nr:hypothetical protein [Bacilli bacterium]
MKKMLFLAKEYYLVVGDRFELFYRGIVKAVNPYHYYIKVTCDKGKPYPRYFMFLPEEKDIGEYGLQIDLVNDDGEIVESSTTSLIVNKPQAPQKPVSILCIGDSLTAGGYWTGEGYRRYCHTGGNPEGLGYAEKINLLGLCKYSVGEDVIGYEGYGGWQWKSFCTNLLPSKTSSIWVDVTAHNKTEMDQHSVWMNHGHAWILETITKKRLKFKRGPGHKEITPQMIDVFTHEKNAIHQEDIVITGFTFESGNPFWNEAVDDIDFKNYIQVNHFAIPDFVYILLTWNGLSIPYNMDFTTHHQYATKFIDKLHEDFPESEIRCMGIQINSINGGIANNYGAKGPYSDMYGTLNTAFHYNRWLEDLCWSEKYRPFCKYLDVKAQFDSEYNMPMTAQPVNARNDILEMIGTNGVHPSLSGYMQIGDVFYRSLVHELNKK